ncbi:MAG: NusG domain II-containing protein [Negativibacillus sp.]
MNQKEPSRARITKKDLVLIGAILLIAVLLGGFFLLKQKAESGIAALSINGEIVELYDLSREEDRLIDLQETYGVPVLLEIQNHAIRFRESQCPDHICENYGFISKETQTAVCMPNRVVLTIYSPQDNVTVKS